MRQKTFTFCRHLAAGLLCFVATQNGYAAAQPAVTPPMGWNSWDAYGTTVTEAQVKANADVMAEKLARFGWQYIVVDIQWYAPAAAGHDYRPGESLSMDEYGRLIPALNRFPSAADGRGFRPLADYIHSKGLKFGIHIMRGIPRQAVDRNLPIKGTQYHAADVADRQNGCDWNPDMWGVDMAKPGSQEYYDSLVELYTSWGVDFIKADDMGSHQFQPAEIRALSEAIARSPRPIVLSISPGPAPRTAAAFLSRNAQMWRISDDFWDDWPLLRRQFDLADAWAPFTGVNNTWPDADMLPIGRLRVTAKEGGGAPSRFTADEQRTMFTLWSVFRSPLIMGGELTSLDAASLALLSNAEVIAVDQTSRAGHEALRKGTFIAWKADAPELNTSYVGLFNLADGEQAFDADWSAVGIAVKDPVVRDLWEHRDLGVSRRLEVRLRPHASVLYRVSQAPK
ncbi:MAG: glycoside hydrolase family 27 protein [Steroidobacteraceae bacterium]